MLVKKHVQSKQTNAKLSKHQNKQKYSHQRVALVTMLAQPWTSSKIVMRHTINDATCLCGKKQLARNQYKGATTVVGPPKV
jgi:hypothetical protein